VLFIGTQFSNLYTAVHTPAKGRVGVCVVFVFACKYVLGHSQVSVSSYTCYLFGGLLFATFPLSKDPQSQLLPASSCDEKSTIDL
jgi:hypothetical protein